MRGYNEDVGAIRPMHSPQDAAAEFGDCFVGAEAIRWRTGLSGERKCLPCRATEHLYQPVCKSPSPPFRGEREGPAKREGEVGGAAIRFAGPPHPALSPRPAGGEGK